jgi:hypothetical protein
VSYDSSRKTFLAKLIGVAAVAGFAPRLFAKKTVATISTAAPTKERKFALRPDTRAVARRDESL